MKHIIQGAALACAITFLITPNLGRAHGLEGDRFFPPTPVTDDPFAVDELSLPEVQYNPASASKEVDVTGSLSKEIFPKFALSDSGYLHQPQPERWPGTRWIQPAWF